MTLRQRITGLALSLALACALQAHGGGHSRGGLSHASATKCAGCARDSHGKIKRSKTATHDFQKLNPCPSTGKRTGACPGYVIDHVVPLKRGGADSPSNMQWQTQAAAKAKDKVE
jgi:hypothetical protein